MRPIIRALLLDAAIRTATLVFRDTFTGANGSLSTHVPDVKPASFVTWTGISNIDITGNQLVGTANSGSATFNPGISDLYVIADFLGNSSIGTTYICVRSSDANNEWRCGYNGTNTVMSIIERNGGTSTTRASVSGASHGTVATFQMEVVASGQTVTLTEVALAQSISYTTAAMNLTTTTVRLVAGASGGSIDNVNVYDMRP